MKALVLKGPRQFCWEDREKPACSPERVLIHTDAVCICGSDIRAIQGQQKMFSFPRVIGHEVAATVEEAGAQTKGFRPGDRVCLLPCIACGHCRPCRRGKPNCCETLRLYGVQEDGGLQEYLSVPPQSLLRIDFDAAPEEIAMMEPLTIGAHAVARLDLTREDRVLILGAGPIGVGCALAACSCGARVVLADIKENRRKFVKEEFQLEILDPFEYDYKKKIKDFTNGELFDAVIDTTASKSSMDHAWEWICHGGKVLFVGTFAGKLELDESAFHMKEPTLYVTRNSTRTDFERVLSLWQHGFIEPAKFITHTAPFSQAAKAVLQWAEPQSCVFKGAVRF
jgi:2-desacetyl-2-hydroxyethyl bacteriochlorophyllide A dehydrogenase